MQTRFVWLSSLLLLVCLLSLMVGCDREGRSINAPMEVVRIDQLDSSAPSEQADKATAAQKAWWRGLSQTARNQAIIERAWRDNGRYVGLNCKEWARKVVDDASKTVVSLPATLPNASGWYFASSPYLVGMSGGIRSAQPGWIVQTNWQFPNGTVTPHTFIVTARGPTGISIIESNWCSSNTVCQRFVSFATFESQVPRYTCYYVIGG